MRKITLAAAIGITLCLSARGAVDFHLYYRIGKAESLFARRDYVKARSEFKELAGAASGPMEKAVISARAAIALGYQEGQYENALAEAARIENGPFAEYALMMVMAIKPDWAGIADQFGRISIADWPEFQLPRYGGPAEDLRVYGLATRAEAFKQTGAFRQADQDLQKAAELCLFAKYRVELMCKLAELRQDNLKDVAGAYEVNLQIAADEWGGEKSISAALAAANYLSQNGRHDEAIAMVDSIGHSSAWQRFSKRGKQSDALKDRIKAERDRVLRAAGKPADGPDHSSGPAPAQVEAEEVQEGFE